ncbi:DUF605-domain-containing protein [Punctularia strigosozonata HHB-11173 SS5]|uniref:DUF605-domain-containing protein n=1 Tax=Punctularia strigosozonata (strain HHB-11173) TaxID=741275 RepID=UPI0004416C3C|nr:DUF605-domain-containing protein [Punctularia strigosozonata HHB-11173 SS5]EIN13951.1 DUF605-domain-containing protein [Punctularia strigosozonata HHB-11173 SS5]
MPLGLPELPTELKSILPFLQRAEEVRKAEPVIAYWSTYHAAQLGIGLKAKSPASRSFLGELLGVLEGMKSAIAVENPEAVETIESESASAAYVENFALKLFESADDADRTGSATRLTARKFLAAANFLELLHVFEVSGLSESDTEKIKYAKWKAAEISKALREGRRPTPGPAGSASDLPPTAVGGVSEQPESAAQVLGVPSAELTLSPSNLVPGIEMPNELIPNTRPILSAASGAWHDGSEQQAPQDHARPALPAVSPLPSTPGLIDKDRADGKSLHSARGLSGIGPSPPPSEGLNASSGLLAPSPPVSTFGSSVVSSSATAAIAPSVRLPHDGAPQTPATTPPTLSPAEMARAQKHCRFAISALDYEDVEQARKELRAALSLLGP